MKEENDMTETTVQSILVERFKTMQGLSRDKDGRITDAAFPNMPFTRPKSGYWYEVYFGSSASMPVELGAEEKLLWTGTMIVNICVPKSSGTQALDARYERVAALFRVMKIQDGIRIRSVTCTPPMDDGDYCVRQVSIVWQSYLDR